jgi:hypothetical protein
MTNALRRLGFAWVLATVVALYTSWLTTLLPPLQDDAGAWLVVVPATGIAALVLAGAHDWVVRAQSHGERLFVLAIATWVAMVLYTSFVVVTLRGAGNPIGLAIVVMAAQVLYGFPLFPLVAIVAKLSSRWLVARPVTRWT